MDTPVIKAQPAPSESPPYSSDKVPATHPRKTTQTPRRPGVIRRVGKKSQGKKRSVQLGLTVIDIEGGAKVQLQVFKIISGGGALASGVIRRWQG